MFDDEPRCQTEETVDAQNIIGGTETNRRSTPGFHAVGGGIILVNLAVRTGRCTAVMMIVTFVVENNLVWAEMVQDTICHWKIIEPHGNMMKEVNEQYLGNAGVGKHAEDTMASFFEH